MNPISRPRPVFATLGAGVLMVVATALGASSTAQVPPGWTAVSAFSAGPVPDGGIFLVHSVSPGAVTRVTGLPADLLGPPPGTTVQWGHGRGSVLVRPRDGALIVGEHADSGVAGTSLDVHVITLNGSAVAAAQAYPIGVPAPGALGSVDQMAWLGEDILIANRGLNLVSGPLAGQVILGLVRPRLGPPGTVGTVVAVPLTSNPTGPINALAIDPGSVSTSPSGQVSGVAYFGKFLTTTGPSQIWRVPVPGGGTPTLVATVQDVVTGLAFDNRGMLLACVIPNGTTLLYSIDVQTGAVVPVPVPPRPSTINGLTVETETGAILFADNLPNTAYRLHQGVLTTLSAPAMTGGGSGIALNPSLWTYGVPSGTGNSWSWNLTPNPGGLPTVGNAGFSLTTSSNGTPALGLVALSLGTGSVPMPPGVTLLLDPNTAVVHQLLLSQASSHTASLPIPNTSSLAGLEVYAQAGFFQSTNWVVTKGLRIGLF